MKASFLCLGRLVTIASALSVLATTAACGEPETKPLPKVNTTVTRVALFKNGLGFVEREGVLPKGALLGELTGLPVPVHGTFWVFPKTDGIELRDVVATTVTNATERTVASFAELLESNSGREVELTVLGPDGKAEVIRGRIRPLGEPKPAPGVSSEVADPFLPAAVSAAHFHSSLLRAEAAPAPNPLLLVETAQGQQLVIERAAVRQVRGTDLKFKMQDTAKRRTSLRARVSRNPDNARLGLMYLAKGIAWAPSYHVELAGDKRARLVAKAEIINDLEDLADARVSVIAGYPNLQFANVVDPLAFTGDLLSWLNTLLSPTPMMSRREAVLSQQVALNIAQPMDGAGADFDPAAFAARGDADLFFYDLERVSLKRGERGYYTLFAAEVACDNIYECRIGQPGAGKRGEEFSEDVWRALRLHNGSAQPWTTAPAMVTQKGLLLGQDTLYYTALGGETLLRFSKAVDVSASSEDREVSRERSVRYLDARWDLVTARGTVKLTNLKPVEITIVVRRAVEGEVTDNPEQGKLSLSERGATGVNPVSNLTWELKIPPRETKELTYGYKKYVR